MAELDPKSNKITIKIVYYGPSLSGKTTNLLRLHDLLLGPDKGQIMMLDTQGDRTLFFDLFPLGFRTATGLLVKFKLYTVPGQVAHDSTRKAVLSRADGLVFVADSQLTQAVNNGVSFDNLADNAASVGLNFEQLPLVVQFNKRDMPNILSGVEIRERWSVAPWPITYAAALAGSGVTETFKRLLRQLYPILDSQYGLYTQYALDEQTFLERAGGVGV